MYFCPRCHWSNTTARIQMSQIIFLFTQIQDGAKRFADLKWREKHVAKITLYTIICHKELTCFRFPTISVPGYSRSADLWRLSWLLPPNIDVRTGMFWRNVIKSSLYIKRLETNISMIYIWLNTNMLVIYNSVYFLFTRIFTLINFVLVILKTM